MRLVCGPEGFTPPNGAHALQVVLYEQGCSADCGSAGAAVRRALLRRKLKPSPRAWDLLSIALSVIAADLAGRRVLSPDGWTRELELDLAVIDPDFWGSQADALSHVLGILTTDRWRIRFHGGGTHPEPPREIVRGSEDSVVLLSGGLDSLTGAIDLVAAGRRPLAVSQTVRGDAENQERFASQIGGGLSHLPLNHNVRVPGAKEPSTRARSLIFLTFGVLAATTLQRYHEGEAIPLFICENGFIAINPPLTGGRLGSLSTRTTHPEYLGRLQVILDAAGLRVQLGNPYQAKTKGEMLRDCADQALLGVLAAQSTSCGRFQRFKYTHCGRCVPCQVRRAAFLAWGVPDTTPYVFEALGRRDADHAGFDDVRAVAMAIAQVEADGLSTWLGPTLSSPMITNASLLKDMISRTLGELNALHRAYGVR